MIPRAQRGTMPLAPVFWIMLILGIVAYLGLPGERPIAIDILYWVAGAGLVLLIVIFSVVPFVAGRAPGSVARDVAQATGGEVREFHRTTFGQNTTEYSVPVQRGSRTVTLQFPGGATIATLEVPQGQAVPFRISAGPGGEPVIQNGDGMAAGQAFLDERVRSNLARVARIGKRADGAVTATVRPDSVKIYKDGLMNARETLLFLNLCWPVFDRALAVSFGMTVEPPARICANCGGECCPTCDAAHEPGCACNQRV